MAARISSIQSLMPSIRSFLSLGTKAGSITFYYRLAHGRKSRCGRETPPLNSVFISKCMTETVKRRRRFAYYSLFRALKRNKASIRRYDKGRGCKFWRIQHVVGVTPCKLLSDTEARAPRERTITGARISPPDNPSSMQSKKLRYGCLDIG